MVRHPSGREHGAFTLIELLLVIGIIAVLAGIVIVAVNPSRQLAQARNGSRRSAVKEIQKAIQQYRIDSGSLPSGLDGSLRMIGTDTAGCTMLCTGSTGSPVQVASRVNDGNDDAEEFLSNGYMYRTSTDLELTNEANNGDQRVGMRFTNITIPQGSLIDSATVTFTVDEVSTSATTVTFTGHDTDNAPAFGSSNYDISNRPRTTASVTWGSIPAWNTVGATHQTPDFSAVIQEIVNRSGWSAGNAVVLIAEGSGRRTAESYNGVSAAAPLLSITYRTVNGETTAESCINLGSALAPTYLFSIPTDPSGGSAARTRYAVRTVGSDARLRVQSCSAELSESILVDQ